MSVVLLNILVQICNAGQKNGKSSSLFKSSDMFMKAVLQYVQRASSSACKQSTANMGSISWYSRERVSKIDMEEKKLLNKVIIFVFFAHKKYSRSFIKLRLNHRCHDYFNNVLTTFLGLERGSCVAVYGGSESSWISSKIS